ncbi:MAG TPA: C4-type zinc ribbon domain-containing protein [Candidatus Binatia bacterium]
MRAQIEILASLQMVDREIREQNVIKQGLKGELESAEKEILSKKQEIGSLNALCAEKEKVRQDKERLLQEEGKKAMDKRMRMNRIKNIKELQALQREIEQIRQGNSEQEEELIKILEEIEGLKANIKAKEDEMTKKQELWQQKQKAMEAQISGIERAVSEASLRRKRIAAQVTGDLITRYELIFARRGGTAVVEVAGGICQGCYMNIPPQLWNEIIKSEKVNLCPSCQRILYHKPALEEVKPA